ncbi:hypothetical protein [Helicobacter sp. UBA3407]|nr:hypothetical protein [Helicobacter sp. UBA3407]
MRLRKKSGAIYSFAYNNFFNGIAQVCLIMDCNTSVCNDGGNGISQ